MTTNESTEPSVEEQTAIERHNAAVDAGTLDPDPREDSTHPLHDIVCGWCGKIHEENGRG